MANDSQPNLHQDSRWKAFGIPRPTPGANIETAFGRSTLYRIGAERLPVRGCTAFFRMKDASREAVIFNMINAMLMRYHLSGPLHELSAENFALVKEGPACYRQIRADIPAGLPFWPLGLPAFDSDWVSLGLRNESRAYLAVWRMNAREDTCRLPMAFLSGAPPSVRCLYPSSTDSRFHWNDRRGALSVTLPESLDLELRSDTMLLF